MVIARSRIADRPVRQYEGEQECDGLIQFLNFSPDSVGKEQIAWLLEMLSNGKEASLEIDRLLCEFDLQPTISFYGARPIVVFAPIPGSSQHCAEEATEQMRSGAATALGDAWKSGPEWAPSRAVGEILSLIDEELISRVQRCRCGKFFFQRFAHKRFCSEACKLAEFQSSPAARRKRNEYARHLYKRKKDLEQGKVS
jgi:hypothetical protein